MQQMTRRKFLKLTVYGTAALIASYPVFIERNLVQVNRYRVPLENLPPSFHGYILAHLTDLHLGPLVSESFIAGVVQRTNSLRPDAIVCTGDYVHEKNTIQEIERVWPLLAELEAADGVFSVLGNHDHWADTDRSLYWLERTGQNIRHICRTINRGGERILIGGAGDYWGDRLNIDEVFSCSDEEECRVLLSHNPDSVDTRFKTPLALVLSGHTHGGQVVLPFFGPPLLPVSNKSYSGGLIFTEKTKLFISRGIGWTILPVRFNCYPEIALLELVNPSLTV